MTNPLVISSGRCRELDADDPLSVDSTWGEHELWNYDWTAQANATYTNGQTGITHGPFSFSAYIPGSGGSVVITNGVGLVVSSPTTLESALVCPAGSNGLSGYFGDNDRWERGGWAIMTQYTYNYPTNATYGYLSLDGTYPHHGMTIRRSRNSQGTPNTAAGGITTSYWWANAEYYTYGGTTTDDILCIHIINPWTYNSYTATYSSGWPKIKDMTLRAAVSMGQNGAQANRTYYKSFENIWFSHGVGGSGSSMTFLKTRIIKVTA